MGKINNLKSVYNTPKIFWDNINELKGNKTNTSPYIIDNKKLYTEEEKEEVFRKIWRDVFSINPEENKHFDANNEVMVNNYIRENEYILLYTT